MNWVLTVFFCLQNPEYGTCESPHAQVTTIENFQSRRDCQDAAIDMVHSGTVKVLHFVCLEKDPPTTVPICDAKCAMLDFLNTPLPEQGRK